MLALVGGHQFQVPAPFVFDPHGVVVFIVRAESQHNLCGVQSGKYVRLILLPQLVLQGNPGEEHPVALGDQGIIYILRDDRIDGTLALIVGFLVADEDVVGLLLAGNLDDALAKLLNLLGFLPVDLPGDSIRILQRLLQVAVLHYAVKAGTMAGGHFLARSRIVYILDTVFAQHQTPVAFCLLWEVGNDCFIDARRLVKFTGRTQTVCPGKQRQLFLIVGTGHRLPAAAVFAFGNGAARFNHQVTAAHFTLDDSHACYPLWFSAFSLLSISANCASSSLRCLPVNRPLRLASSD